MSYQSADSWECYRMTNVRQAAVGAGGPPRAGAQTSSGTDTDTSCRDRLHCTTVVPGPSTPPRSCNVKNIHTFLVFLANLTNQMRVNFKVHTQFQGMRVLV